MSLRGRAEKYRPCLKAGQAEAEGGRPERFSPRVHPLGAHINKKLGLKMELELEHRHP